MSLNGRQLLVSANWPVSLITIFLIKCVSNMKLYQLKILNFNLGHYSDTTFFIAWKPWCTQKNLSRFKLKIFIFPRLSLILMRENRQTLHYLILTSSMVELIFIFWTHLQVISTSPGHQSMLIISGLRQSMVHTRVW